VKNVLRVGYWVLGAAVVGLVGCGTTTPSATPWEIIHGTSTLALSKALTPVTHTEIVNYTGRTGKLTVADDSTITGWRKLNAGDSAAVTGTVTFIGDSVVMTLTGVTPSEYTVLTSPSFPSTYALLSTAILNTDITGDGTPEQYRVYWEFHR
jgi:hypothetical protein